MATRQATTPQQPAPTIKTIEDLRRWYEAQQRSSQQKQGTKPCGQDRPAYDVAGRINDLINCYLSSAGELITVYMPLVLIALLLIVVMVFAAKSFIEG